MVPRAVRKARGVSGAARQRLEQQAGREAALRDEEDLSK